MTDTLKRLDEAAARAMGHISTIVATKARKAILAEIEAMGIPIGELLAKASEPATCNDCARAGECPVPGAVAEHYAAECPDFVKES